MNFDHNNVRKWLYISNKRVLAKTFFDCLRAVHDGQFPSDIHYVHLVTSTVQRLQRLLSK